MAKKPSAYISSLTFSSGQEVSLGQRDKVVLVGPNNSGKSQSLREITIGSDRGDFGQNVVIKNMAISKDGTSHDLRRFLEENADFVEHHYRYGSWALYEGSIESWDTGFLRNELRQGFIKNIAANDRLRICDQQESISPDEQKTKPQHILYDDDELMRKVTALFRKAFSKDIMFDFRGGKKLPIHVGELPGPHVSVDRISNEYANAVRANPLLDKQGDGIKSYAGILFEAVVDNLDVTMIDEPEAFLHPPQMRRLGQTLAEEVNGQLIVATHSSDILRGFLEGTKGSIRVMRISRAGNFNYIAEAPPSTIQELWEKPELRYSNALDSIFHEQVIICEDDSDCRLINSVADHLETLDAGPWQDTAYVPAGGKHGIPKLASVLRQIGVPVKAVFDIDFLSEQDLVKRTIEAFGGTWSDFEEIWRRVDSAVRDGIKPKSKDEIKRDILSLLSSCQSDELPKGDITSLMKQDKPWSMVKRFGSVAIPKGDAQSYYNDLTSSLESIGIFVVPVGEAENFCPHLGLHGPKFVMKLLSEVPMGDEKLASLRNFVQKVHKGSHGLQAKIKELEQV